MAEVLGSNGVEAIAGRIVAEFGEEGCPFGWTCVVPTANLEAMPPFIVFVAVFPRSAGSSAASALRAVLAAVDAQNEGAGAGRRPIRSVLCPALGSFAGQPATGALAAEMAQAYVDHCRRWSGEHASSSMNDPSSASVAASASGSASCSRSS
eukprot:TRINITY_DN75572_c0_g1_i1.p3 TRINITY_DN75572_c0_g1~~TRINITY_DN75572_c0_g1_i1.p3  ORF type:complete len:152 (+),score=32.02 TRINITY_DN75572_c0_g1_i1:200-655(+)